MTPKEELPLIYAWKLIALWVLTYNIKNTGIGIINSKKLK